MEIPIQNIYFLLSYAWNKLEEKEIVAVEAIDSNSILDLFAKVLASGMIFLLRRGFDRNYVPCVEQTGRITGKINFVITIKKNFFYQPNVYCEYDELHYNVLHNQIIKTTILKLIRYKQLSIDIHENLLSIYRKLVDIEVISLTKRHFGLVQLHSNNYFYDFLLKICELINDNLFISEKEGESKFRDFLRDDKAMAGLFEAFVRNFYKRELTGFNVRKKNIEWDAEALDEASKGYLPKMQTDIYLDSPNRKIIIDTKYYKEALQAYYDKKSIISANINQLYAYLTNIRFPDCENYKCEGILLYPTVGDKLNLNYDMKGHPVSIKTIDLNQEWSQIHNDLLAVVA